MIALNIFVQVKWGTENWFPDPDLMRTGNRQAAAGPRIGVSYLKMDKIERSIFEI